MPAEIVTVGFCADNYAVFEVPSNTDPKRTYKVVTSGSGGNCNCPSWKYRQDCSHMKRVWEEACLYNPQWKDPGPDTLHPIEHLLVKQHYGECPGCGGPLVPVKIAV